MGCRCLPLPALRVLGAARPDYPAARREAVCAALQQGAHRVLRQVVRRVDWDQAEDRMAAARLPRSAPLTLTRPHRRRSATAA